MTAYHIISSKSSNTVFNSPSRLHFNIQNNSAQRQVYQWERLPHVGTSWMKFYHVCRQILKERVYMCAGMDRKPSVNMYTNSRHQDAEYSWHMSHLINPDAWTSYWPVAIREDSFVTQLDAQSQHGSNNPTVCQTSFLSHWRQRPL